MRALLASALSTDESARLTRAPFHARLEGGVDDEAAVGAVHLKAAALRVQGNAARALRAGLLVSVSVLVLHCVLASASLTLTKLALRL